MCHCVRRSLARKSEENLKGAAVDARRLRDGFVRGSAGVTLVELMVAVGLFGVLSLAMMTLFGDHSTQIAKARNEARLSESLGEFSEALDLYLSGVTQVISCGCGFDGITIVGTPCTYVEGATGLEDCKERSAPCWNPILRFEYEDAGNPSLPTPAAGCVNSGSSTVSAAITPEQLILRGCKKRMRLSYTAPVIEVGATASQPGTLTLDLEDPKVANPAPGAGLTTLHTLRGVYLVRCGHVEPTGTGTGKASKDHFRLRLRLKERLRNDAASTSASYESWAKLGKNFWSGTHREISLDFSFQNLSVHGVHFGKPFSNRDCVLGSSSSADGNCCSGYRLVSGACMSMDSCKKGGKALSGGNEFPSDPGNPAFAFAECCSHKMIAASGACR